MSVSNTQTKINNKIKICGILWQPLNQPLKLGAEEGAKGICFLINLGWYWYQSQCKIRSDLFTLAQQSSLYMAIILP